MIAIRGRVQGGVFSNVRHLHACFRDRFEGLDVVITVRRKQTKWTNQQRKYLFGAIYPFVADVLGCTDEDAVAVCLQRFWFKYVGAVKIPRSHTEMEIDDFDQYLTNIDVWLVENYGVNIPPADEDDQGGNDSIDSMLGNAC